MKMQYFPERKVSAYASPVLISRLRQLIAERELKTSKGNPERWAETLLIVGELTRRKEGFSVCALAKQLGPETHALSRRTMPVIDYPLRKQAA